MTAYAQESRARPRKIARSLGPESPDAARRTEGDGAGRAARPRKETGRSLAYGSLFALLIYICGAGLTSLAQLLIARLVGTSSYGIYAYTMAWATVLAYLSTLGFNVSLLRFVPAYNAVGRMDLARGVIRFALRRAMIAATLCAGIGAALIVTVSDHLGAELRTSLLLGMAAVPLITAYSLGATLVRAFGGVISALLPERIVRDGLLLIILAGAGLAGSWALDAPVVMMAAVTSSAVTAGLAFTTAIRLCPASLRGVTASYAPGEWWAAAPPIMLITGLDVFINRTGVMLLGWTGDVRNAGIFAVGLNVAMLVALSRVAISIMFAPSVADLHARNDMEGLRRQFARATLLCFGGAVTLAVPLLLAIEPFLRWFGEDFVAAAPITRILILGYVFAAAWGPQQNLLTMTGREWAAATTMIAGAVTNVLGGLIGVMLYGPIGAAIGITFALVVWHSSMAVYIFRRLNMLPGLALAALALKRQILDRRGAASPTPRVATDPAGSGRAR
ncbi:lipopolysaccharide biosynthesis protein [Kaistia adipata]|uniref:lipopolysaccharide biosynthesis protein n=1 Tax=Kaistia adipata TaxID=166954 RepID=UPI00040AAD50|nr:oligosaccharide flippase family protein [Kaistia adipata]